MMDALVELEAWLASVAAWLTSTFAALDWHLLHSDNVLTSVATGGALLTVALSCALIVLLERRSQVLTDELVMLRWGIDDLKSRMIALEVVAQRRQREACRTAGES